MGRWRGRSCPTYSASATDYVDSEESASYRRPNRLFPLRLRLDPNLLFPVVVDATLIDSSRVCGSGRTLNTSLPPRPEPALARYRRPIHLHVNDMNEPDVEKRIQRICVISDVKEMLLDLTALKPPHPMCGCRQ
ncbi:hypothetical protein KC355_g10 [Hortaea werneckii]|nr:hypothetical protein KC355_g10 [Hortaea werneckii]